MTDPTHKVIVLLLPMDAEVGVRVDVTTGGLEKRQFTIAYPTQKLAEWAYVDAVKQLGREQ